MAPGVTLAVLGAILAFAVRVPVSATINWHVVGVILMVAGAGLIWHARRGTTHERVVTRVERPAGSDAHGPVGETTVREVVEDREHE